MVNVLSINALNKIRIFMIRVVRIGCVLALQLRQSIAFLCKKTQKSIPTMSNFFTQLRLQDNVELYTAYTGTQPTIVFHIGTYQFSALTLGDYASSVLVVPLASLAKQPAECLDCNIGIFTPQRLYCLTPPFFNIEIPSSFSVISIIFSKARLRIFS